MRKSGSQLLHSFVQGISLIAPQFIPGLRSLAEHQAQDGALATLLRPLSALMGRGDAAKERLADNMSTNDTLCAAYGVTSGDRTKPFAFSDGIALIPVHGTLLHRDDYSYGGATGYDYIGSRFRAALADPDVKGIIFDVDSGGGHVAGCFELCQEIRDGRDRKPSVAVVDASGYSAAYAISSAASKIIAAPSAGVGSIGVVAMHISVEGFLEKHGIDVSLVHAGEHKVDSYPFNGLSESARARMQEGVDKTYEKFIAEVALGRSSMKADEIRATQALTYDADAALSLGLIDAIQTRAQAWGSFHAELTGSANPQQGANKMSDTTAAPAAAAAEPAAAVAAAPAAASTATNQPDAAANERARVQGITMCEEAKGREALANHLAFNTSMSVEDAKKTLVAAQPTKAASGAFANAMDSTGNPNIVANGGGDGAGEKMSAGQRIAKNWSHATGHKLREK